MTDRRHRRGPAGRARTDGPSDAQRAIKVGDPIRVTQDDGSTVDSVCTAAPWQLGGHTWVLQYEGRSGAYLLTRCQPLGDARQARQALDLINSVTASMGGTQRRVRRKGGSGRGRK